MSYEERLPPQDADAERFVLGAMLISKDAITDVVGVLRADDYYRPEHEAIHTAIVDLYTSGEPVDVITVSDALRRREGTPRAAKDPLYLHSLTAAVPVTLSAATWAATIAEKATLRRVAAAGQAMTQWAYDESGTATEVLDRAQAKLYAAAPRDQSTDYAKIGDGLDAALDHVQSLDDREAGEAYGVPTGFIDLDELLGGLHGGQMVVVAGRPAMGKSTLAVDFLRSASVHNGIASCMFSLEMNRAEITTRVLAAEARVPLQKLRAGGMTDFDWGRIAAVMPRLSPAPLFIDDSPNLTMTEIRAKARRLSSDHGLGLIAIDYLQLMTSGQRVENRQVEVSEFSRQIKLLAKELDVPVVALSQLNRGVESRSVKRPMLSDLRESGAIEQDADVVILVHREDEYDKDSGRPGEADVIVAKHRNGPTRDVVLAFQGHYSRFANMAPA